MGRSSVRVVEQRNLTHKRFWPVSSAPKRMSWTIATKIDACVRAFIGMPRSHDDNGISFPLTILRDALQVRRPRFDHPADHWKNAMRDTLMLKIGEQGIGFTSDTRGHFLQVLG